MRRYLNSANALYKVCTMPQKAGIATKAHENHNNQAERVCFFMSI